MGWRRLGMATLMALLCGAALGGCGPRPKTQGAQMDKAQSAKLHAHNDELRTRLRTTQIDR